MLLEEEVQEEQDDEAPGQKQRQELDDLYEQLKDRLEKKNTTLEAVVFEALKYLPTQFANSKGVQQVFEKLQLILSRNEAEAVLTDMRATYNGKFECSFKDFIDFLTKRRINSVFNDKGFVDPMIAQCCQ